MHKMLEDYFEKYLCLISREKKLESIEKYKKAYDELNELQDKIEKIINLSHSDDYNLVERLDDQYWIIKTISEKDAFEVGFNAGLKIGMNACKEVVEDEERM